MFNTIIQDIDKIDPKIEFVVENFRHEYRPDCLVFNVENFLLVGTDIDNAPLSLDRSTNL
jgi:hypothetical protein